MKILLGLILALAGASIYLLNTPSINSQLQSSNSLYEEFQIWKKIHGKSYTGAAETQKFQAWLDNYYLIEDFNAKETTNLRLGINNFSDLTNAEFKALYTSQMKISNNEQQEQYYQQISIDDDLPTGINWKRKGAVGWPRNQGACPAGWAFSVVEALEAVYEINKSYLPDFSIQQLVDCANSDGYTTCSGEQTDNIYLYTYNYTKVNGIQGEAGYPYVSGRAGLMQKCQYNADKVVYKNSGAVAIPPKNQQEMVKAIAQQPISVSINSDSYVFQNYKEGVIYNNCGENPDTSVLVYGYETKDPNEPFSYYLIQNSWSYFWGNYGTGKIAMNGNGPGVCGIQTSAAYPLY